MGPGEDRCSHMFQPLVETCSPATLLAFITPAARCQKESSAATWTSSGDFHRREKLPPPSFKLPSAARGAEQIKGNLPERS